MNTEDGYFRKCNYYSEFDRMRDYFNFHKNSFSISISIQVIEY